MKKLLAVLLALICACSAFTAYVSAADILGGIGDQIFGDALGGEEDEGDVLSYGIHYEMAMLSNVSLYYKPSPSISFNTPTYLKVTEDTPIALDHDWIAWRDPNTGKLYYPGDVIYIDGIVTLEAVWVEKTDNYPGFIRNAIAGLKAFIRLIEKFMGVYDAISSPDPIVETTAPAEVK